MDEQRKIQKVVGLGYAPENGLPQIILKGVGPLADEILRRRWKAGGPKIVRNAELTEQLYRLPIDSQIGPELFRAVATILAHILTLDAKHKEDTK